MPNRIHRSVVLLACRVVALCFHGCGGANTPNSEARTTVIVMRHCVRATPGTNDIEAGNVHRDDDDYSTDTWPAFPVPAWFCLPRGEQFIFGQGKWFQSQGGLPLPIRAAADNTETGQRDNKTMHRFLEGLGIAANSFSAAINHRPFTCNTTACLAARPNKTEMIRAMNARIHNAERPADYEELMQLLYAKLGNGKARNWTDIPCAGVADNGNEYAYPSGSCMVGGQLTERLMMQWGGGMEIGWGRVPPAELPNLMKLHEWYFHQWFGLPEIAQWYSSPILNHVASSLSKAEPGTTLFVGHDADLAGLNSVLGLSWKAHPFYDNATLPGSMIRFDRHGDTVTASYLYVGNYSVDPAHVKMSSSVAYFAGKNRTSLDAIQSLVSRGTLAACSNIEGPSAADKMPESGFPDVVV